MPIGDWPEMNPQSEIDNRQSIGPTHYREVVLTSCNHGAYASTKAVQTVQVTLWVNDE